ncbi:cAMP-binding domain of CRP or a regulatory subunit of cAMP-dependent protein kinases [Loktanella fryxellensis]|uniref:cAMP-binding domain of CRP or a regulatory subunit of cAMP-dependent protein kinases n=1 Tax=Loktanella fryxellensis TaxID=245187 RepID=A0A1H8CUC6_9RHOB|nr:Crp/Fnr family transcriptional regulator [Loktanella fryxellensis]SEM98665.1 cAMP-binding domain of CRP or a regulatory subunit of cAMP-dependent protein kinases [Loktanella fryxellensis]
MKPNQSAFLTRICRHATLDTVEREALIRLEGQPESRSKRDPVFTDTRPDDRIAILRSGWAVARVRSAGDQTTITQIYMAGDIIGLSDLGFKAPQHETTMQTDGVVNLLSRSALCDLGLSQPRLFAMLLSLSSLDATAMNDRLHAITRFSAEDRLMHFLLSIKAKTEQTMDHASDRFPLPFSQKEIGDALGLTDIYVNRLLRGLQKSGQLTLSRPYVRITDRAAWEQRLNFQDRFGCLDVNWAS